MKFLLIDDHKIIRDGLKRILLSYFPFSTIEEGASAEDVFDKINNHSFDIVICDLSMPGRSGLDVVNQIKEFHPNLPVLILSMHPDEHYALRALKAGAAGYINKASGSDELLAAIQKILQGRKYVSPEVVEKITDGLSEINEQPHELLSDREFFIFKLIGEGKPLTEIANQLSLSLSTVGTYRGRIMKKMKMNSNADLIKYALQHDLL